MRRAHVKSVLVLVAALACLGGCSRDAAPSRQFAQVDEARIRQADSEPQNWFTTGRTFGEERFSPLDQISETNVETLGFAWQYDLKTARGLEATPVVVDGVMFTSSAWSKVYALDARTGQELWSFDPKVPGAWARRACCDVVNRGVAVWRGKVYVGTLDGRLIALDAATGKELWRQDTLIDRERFYTITGAPRVAGGNVVIGNGGAEVGVRGYFSAYDTETGKLAWRFFTVPGSATPPFEHPELETAAKTWDPNSRWETGGGGTVWDAMAYDPELNLLYVGTGNANPYPISLRSPNGGDNLYLSSILAIDAKSGRLAWHYQTTPGESWDFTAVQHIVLADLKIGDRLRKVLMQAPKNGFFYVLDRVTGELLSAEKYVEATWASHVDLKTGRPVKTSQGDYTHEAKLITPSVYGGHNWHPMAYSPQTGLVYIPTIESSQYLSVDASYTGYEPGRFNVGISGKPGAEGEITPMTGALKAWNPITQREAWRIEYPYPYNSGLLATAGKLVFQGTTDGYLRAYAADTGARVAEIFVGTSIMAAPMSYAIDGVQYVAVMAGLGGAHLSDFSEGSAARRYGNAGRVVAFRLGGGTVPVPPEITWDQGGPPPPRMSTNVAELARGKRLFDRFCGTCHRDDDAPGGYPNLLRLAPEKHRIFNEIVLGGALAGRGMASFADVIDASGSQAIQAYLIDRAHALPR